MGPAGLVAVLRDRSPVDAWDDVRAGVGETDADLLLAADRALHLAKNSGREQVVISAGSPEE